MEPIFIQKLDYGEDAAILRIVSVLWHERGKPDQRNSVAAQRRPASGLFDTKALKLGKMPLDDYGTAGLALAYYTGRTSRGLWPKLSDFRSSVRFQA
jgi:hypothetical protein